MEKQTLTRKEQEVYSFILEYRRDMRFTPSMREIADGMGLNSVSTVHRHVHSLIDKGWLLPYVASGRSAVPTSVND